jgi:hypothetical protein
MNEFFKVVVIPERRKKNIGLIMKEFVSLPVDKKLVSEIAKSLL